MNIFNVSFITGLSFGLELYLGDALQEDDKFAMTLDLGIIRFTYVYTLAEE